MKKPSKYQREQQRKLSLYKNVLEIRETPAEVKFKYALKRLGIKFIFQKGFMKDRLCIVDFYLPKPHKLCIEIDGEYHLKKEQQEYDFKRTQYLKDRGLRVIRFTNEEAFNLTDEQILKRLNLTPR